jgi:hypothetical protein
LGTLGNDRKDLIEMSIRKSLIALAAMAIAMMGLASSAVATDGVVRHVPNGTIIPNNRVLHSVGWAKFAAGSGSFECHVTSAVEIAGSTGTTGYVSSFTIPDTTKCTGTGLLNGCKLKAHAGTHLLWHVTATPTDFDVTSIFGIVIDNEFSSCLARSATLTFSEVTLRPLKTGIRFATNTFGHLGETAGGNEPIAGVELSGAGTVSMEDIFGGKKNEGVTATGELELSASDRCTWFINGS